MDFADMLRLLGVSLLAFGIVFVAYWKTRSALEQSKAPFETLKKAVLVPPVLFIVMLVANYGSLTEAAYVALFIYIGLWIGVFRARPPADPDAGAAEELRKLRAEPPREDLLLREIIREADRHAEGRWTDHTQLDFIGSLVSSIAGAPVVSTVVTLALLTSIREKDASVAASINTALREESRWGRNADHVKLATLAQTFPLDTRLEGDAAANQPVSPELAQAIEVCMRSPDVSVAHFAKYCAQHMRDQAP